MASSTYNHHRYARLVLRKFRKVDATFTIELYPDIWRFQGHAEDLTYDGPMRFFLEGLRSQSIPTGLLPLVYSTETRLKLYDGCVIVEIHDFRGTAYGSDPGGPGGGGGAGGGESSSMGAARRPSSLRKLQGEDHWSRNPFLRDALRSKLAAGAGAADGATYTHFRPVKNGTGAPDSGGAGGPGDPASAPGTFVRSRCIMKSDQASTWEQIVYLNQTSGEESWEDDAALALEARILAGIAPPLMLDPSPVLPFRVAQIASAFTAPARPYLSANGSFIPRSQRRPAASESDEDSDEDEDDVPGDEAKRARKRAKAGEAARKELKVDHDFDRDMLMAGRAQQLSDAPKHQRLDWLETHNGFNFLRNRQMPLRLPVNASGDAAANAPALNGHANGSINGADGSQAGANGDAAPKKPSKKMSKKAAAALAEQAAAEAARVKEEEAKPKPKKKKDATNGATKGKKRAADDVSVAASDAQAQPADDEDGKPKKASKKKAGAASAATPAAEAPPEPPKKKKKAAPKVEPPAPPPTFYSQPIQQQPDVNMVAQQQQQQQFNGGMDIGGLPQITAEHLTALLQSQAAPLQGFNAPGAEQQQQPIDLTGGQPLQNGSNQNADEALANFIASLASSQQDLSGIQQSPMGSRAPGGSRAPPGP